MATYDVFISCKSEDYKYAGEIYDYLKNLGINAFLASRELRRLGESEYRRAISKALKEAYHIIVFASDPKFIESTWVEYEWDMFINAKLKGKKQGNILTILKDVSTDDIPMDLWKYESFKFDDYRQNLMKYVETPESIERKNEIKKKREEEERKREEEKAKARRIAELKSKLEVVADEYKKSEASLQVDADKINNILTELDITNRECPICHNSLSLKEKICATCGWPVSPLEGLPELSYLNNDQDNFKGIYTSIYNAYIQLKQESNSSIGLKELILSLEKELKHLNDEYSRLKEKSDKDFKVICQAKVKIEKLNDICKKREEELSLSNAREEKLKEEVANYQSDMVTMQKDNKRLQKELTERQTIIEKLNQKIAKLDTLLHFENESSSSTNYSVWVTFCPIAANAIVFEYNKAFISNTTSARIEREAPIFVASFSSLDEADALKYKLESKGATVEIRKGKKIVVPNSQRSNGRPMSFQQNDSSKTSDTAKYGIRIANCGKNRMKVADVLSKYFNRSANSFSSVLQTLPYFSTLKMPRLG